MGLTKDSKLALAKLAADMRAEDVRKAANLRKTRHLHNKKAGTGPRVAR